MKTNIDNFIIAIHIKIERRKKRIAQLFSINLAALMIVFSFWGSRNIHDVLYDRLFTQQNQSEIEFYDWEILPEISKEAALLYLIDDLEMNELMDVFDNTDVDLQFLTKL